MTSYWIIVIWIRARWLKYEFAISDTFRVCCQTPVLLGDHIWIEWPARRDNPTNGDDGDVDSPWGQLFVQGECETAQSRFPHRQGSPLWIGLQRQTPTCEEDGSATARKHARGNGACCHKCAHGIHIEFSAQRVRRQGEGGLRSQDSSVVDQGRARAAIVLQLVDRQAEFIRISSICRTPGYIDAPVREVVSNTLECALSACDQPDALAATCEAPCQSHTYARSGPNYDARRHPSRLAYMLSRSPPSIFWSKSVDVPQVFVEYLLLAEGVEKVF